MGVDLKRVLAGIAFLVLAVPVLSEARVAHYFSCTDCHRSALDQTGLSAVCLKCHDDSTQHDVGFNDGTIKNRPKGVFTRASDESSVAGSQGTSHRYTGTDNVPAAGAQPPTSTKITGSWNASRGTIVCSRCHDPHADTIGNTKILKINTADDALCLDCHRGWNLNNNNATLSHPVNVDYATATNSTNDPNNNLYDTLSGSQAQLVGGKVSCTSCHAVHYADSDASTADGMAQQAYVAGLAPTDPRYNALTLNYTTGLGTGDGNLLRGDGPLRRVTPDNDANSTLQAQLRSNVCQTCHTYKLHGKTADAGPQIGCLDCHSGHSYNGGVSNIYVLRPTASTFAPRYGNAYTTGIDLMAGSLMNGRYNAPYDKATNDNWSDRQISIGGYCENCHGDVQSAPILGKAVAGHTTTSTKPCTECHKHNGTSWAHSWQPDVSAASCGDCHGFPPYLNLAGDRIQWPANDGGYAYSDADTSTTIAPIGTKWNYSSHSGSFKNEAQTAHNTHAGGSAANPNYYFVGGSGTENCEVCHGLGAGFDNRHRDMTRQASFRDILFDNGVASAGGALSPAYKTGAPNIWTCSNIYCHTNGGPRDNAGLQTYQTHVTPAWDQANGGGLNAILGSGTRCQFCHGNDATSMGAGQKNASQAHIKHLNKGYTCNACHVNTASSNTALAANATRGDLGGKHVNSVIDVNYDLTYNLGSGLLTAGAPYNSGNGTCSVYCHSNGLGANVTTVDWQVASTGANATCTACHNGNVANGSPMASGSHTQHINGTVATLGRQMACVECHSTTVSNDTTVSNPTNHVNGIWNLGIQADSNKTSCASIKCHSNGNIDGGTLTYKILGTDYVWGTNNTIGCASCHGNGTVAYPTYANGGVGSDSNSHAAHANIACGKCHATVTTVGTSIDGSTPSQHVNMSIDVAAGNGASFTWTAGTETCSTNACHGDLAWGQTSLNCGSCHEHATADTDDFTFDNGTTAKVATNEWTFSGHGKTSSTYEVTGRTAANFQAAAGTGDPCKYCHDGSVSHNATTNYFRLRINTVAGVTAGDLNTVCLGCHDTSGTGVDPDGGSTVYANKTASVKVDKYHQGAKHGGANDGGRWCWDCHDPHGDASAAGARIQMIQKRAQVNPDTYGVPASLTATDILFTNRTTGAGIGGFARDAAWTVARTEGICNACHTSTSQYTGGVGANGHTTAQCTTCHQHSKDDIYNGDAFQGSGCNGCHGDTGTGQYWPNGSGGNPAYVDTTAGAHNGHISAIGAYLGYGDWTVSMYSDVEQKAICAFCHPNPGATGHDTNGGGDSTVDVIGAGAFVKFSGSGTTQLDTGSGNYSGGSCATLACHNGVNTPASWNTPPAADCTTLCHGPNTSVTAREGHKKHVYDKGYACTQCHPNHGTSYGHLNGVVNLVFNNPGTLEQTYGPGSVASYSEAGPNMPRDGAYGTCANIYCHADKTTPAWSGTINATTGCIDCHTAGGATLNPNSGLHTGATPTVSGAKHDNTLTGGCIGCHAVGALGSHINGTFSGNGSVAGDRTNMGLIAGFTTSGSDNTGTCSGGTVSAGSCHGGGDAGTWARKWDSAIHYGTLVSGTPCAGCHGGFAETDWTFGSVSNTTDGSVEHNRNWDGDGASGEVIGDHRDNASNGTRCNICHVYADAPYNSGAFTTYHRNGSIDMNSSMGYSSTTFDCTNTCHSNNTNHNLEDSGWAVNPVAGPALSCATCHGNGSDQYWPNGVSYPNRAGEHAAHITKLAAALGLGAGPYTQAQQQRMCAYCHNDPTDIAGYSGQTGHADGASPANVGAFNPMWNTADPPVTADDGTATAGACSNIDCHNNKTTTPTWDWYAGAATSCDMCHATGASDATHTAHMSAGMGMTITCTSCHGAGTTASTPPTAGHINGGAVAVSGSVAFTYTGGLTGSCGTNACHYNGRYVSAARQAPKASSYAWGTPIAGCDACHETTSLLSSGSHTAHMTTTSQAMTCNSCHTAGTVATHIDGNVNFTGAAASYNASTPEPTTDETFSTCGTNTCHNNGKNAAPYNNGLGSYTWNTAIGGVNSCTECHNNAALGELHSNHTGAATLFGINTVTCDSCHTAGAAAGTHSGHVEGTIALVAGLAYSGTPNSVNVTLNTFGTCNTTTCHSNGRGSAVLTPAWNDASSTGDDCTLCHGNTGATLSTSGAHNTHLGAVAWGPHPTGSTNCGECHLSPANNTSMATYATHINGTVSLTGPFEVATGAMATDTTATTCNNCHGGLTAANAAAGAKKSWAAATRIACETCHGDYTVANTLANGTGTNAPSNAGISYDTYGHNKVTNNPTYGGKACTDCHDNTAAGHIDGDQLDKRMKSVNSQTYSAATNNFCASACHGGTAENAHYANSNTPGNGSDDGIYCMTCHNPHGQNGNQDAMIRSTIQSRAVAGFTDKTQRSSYANVSNNGVCQVCHDSLEVNYFNRIAAPPAHLGGTDVCTSCHSHSGTTAFSASGGGCDGCHGYPPVQQLSGAGAAYTFAKLEDYPGGGRAHAVVAHINPVGLDPTDGWAPCAPCHTEADHNMGFGVGNLLSARDTSGNWGNEAARYPRVNLDAAYDKGGTAFYNMGARNTTAGMGYCSNASCHFGESPKWDCVPASTTNDPQ